ncbi:MAG: BNR-4 repeat-containing protein [Myxococcota bacterium]
MKRGKQKLGVVRIAALVAIPALFVASAGATSFDLGTDTALTIDANAHDWNQVQVRTFGNFQYMVFWDSDASLKITRRRLSDNNLQSITLADTLNNVNDGHSALAFGLSGSDGRIHISWSPHGNSRPHHYWISSAGCLSQGTFSSCSFTMRNFQADSTHEGKLTYPNYFNDQSGRLYFTYRFDASARSDQYLNKYNADAAGSWTSLGMIIHGRTAGDPAGVFDPDGAGPAQPAQERGVYVSGPPQFDKNDRLHMMFTWREHVTSWSGGFPTGYRGLWAQHDLLYVYSDDYGVTWRKNDGVVIATSGSDPLVVNDTSAIALSIPAGNWFLTGSMRLDSNNQPHVMLTMSDAQLTDGLKVKYRLKHVWRTSNGAWYSQFIEPASAGRAAVSWPELMFDRGDGAYVVYGVNEFGWAPYNTDPYKQVELPNRNVTWQGGEFMDVQQHSSLTCIDTTEYLGIPISASGTKQIRVRMKNNTDDTTIWFSFTTDTNPDGEIALTQTFPITARDATYKDYVFDMSANPNWTGTLRMLEICPVHFGTADPGDSVSIDYIRLTDAAGKVTKGWEFQAGQELRTAEASPTNNWPNWGIDDLLPGVSDTLGDGPAFVDQQRYTDSGIVNFAITEQGNPGIERISLREFDIGGDDVAKNWGFDVDTVFWTAPLHVGSFGWVNDGGIRAIGGNITGNDSRIISADNLKVPLGNANKITIRMKNTSAATVAHVYFITNSDTTWNEPKSKTFAITPNSGYTTYTVDMSAVPGWTNQTLRRLRLDPSDQATVTSGSFRVDRIYIAP